MLVGGAGGELELDGALLRLRHVSLCFGQSECWQSRPQYLPPHRLQRHRALTAPQKRQLEGLESAMIS